MLTFLRSSSPVLVMTSSMSVPICNHFHVGGANSGRITPFKGRALVFSPRSGDPLYPAAEILSRNTRDFRLSCGVKNPKSLSRLILKRYRVVADGQTDGQTDRRTELP